MLPRRLQAWARQEETNWARQGQGDREQETLSPEKVESEWVGQNQERNVPCWPTAGISRQYMNAPLHKY